MTRGALLLVSTLLVFSPFRFAYAQRAGKVPRIGFLQGLAPSANSDRIEAFRLGLRELGYVEGEKHRYRDSLSRGENRAPS